MSELRYKKSARNFNESLPLGNGRIGMSMYGGVYDDRIQINEETLWSGYPGRDKLVHKREDLDELRALIEKRDYRAAEAKCAAMVPTTNAGGFVTFGCVRFELLDTVVDEYSNYSRSLDIASAVYKSEFSINNWELFSYQKEAFCSFADDIGVYHFKCNQPYNNIYVHAEPYLKSSLTAEGDTIEVIGRCPTDILRGGVLRYEEDKESVEFCMKLKIVTDGKVVSLGNILSITACSEFTAYLSIGTSFNGFDKMPISEGKDARKECDGKLNSALIYNYDELKARHMAAYGKFYNRTSIDFDGEEPCLTTDERIKRLGALEEDPKLIETLYDFGRYMLISSSQKGGQAANLQGIWSRDVIAPWNSNYTTNINLEMNYWGAEQAGLFDCHEPVLAMLRDLAGKPCHIEGMRGWYLAHNTDIWRYSLEVSHGTHAFWQMGGVWLCRDIYEHYAFTQDKKFLADNFFVLDGVDKFLRDFMVRDKAGKYTTSPSESPENRFLIDGVRCSISSGCAMDISLISDFYKNMIEIAKVLCKDPGEYENIYNSIAALKIGKDGRLMEFCEEFDENDKGHRHISHLCGYFPLHLYEEDGKYFEAMKRSLEFRLDNGGGGTGWSNAWITNMYTRMKDADRAYSYLVRMFRKSMYPNMFDAHPPFQADGNYGIMCAISEMVVQSHRGKIELLPAISKELSNGSAKGIRARGGYTVNLTWKNAKVTSLEVFDKDGCECSERLIREGKLILR